MKAKVTPAAESSDAPAEIQAGRSLGSIRPQLPSAEVSDTNILATTYLAHRARTPITTGRFAHRGFTLPSKISKPVLKQPELIQAVMSQKYRKSPETFVDDANCVLEALLASMDFDAVKAAIRDHSLHGPSYPKTAEELHAEAVKRRPQRKLARKIKEAKRSKPK